MTRHTATAVAAALGRAARRLSPRHLTALTVVAAVAVAVVAAGHLTAARGGPATVDTPATATATTATAAPDVTSPAPGTAATTPPPATPATPPAGVAGGGPATATAGSDAGDDPAPATRPDVTITAGPVDPADAATTITVKILNTYGKTPDEWRASFVDLLTAGEAARYADADPAGVPPYVVAAHPTVTVAGRGIVDASVPVATDDTKPAGTVEVTLVGTSGRWLAEQITPHFRGAP